MPTTLARARMNEVQRTEHSVAQQRRETVPTARTETVDPEDSFPVSTRTARFLTDNGATRTEVYWSVDPADVTQSPDDQFRGAGQRMMEPERHLLRLTGILYGPNYASRRGDRANLLIDPDRSEPAVYSLVLPETTNDPYHLALQWDQYALSSDSSAAFVRSSLSRADSLEALPNDAARLVLSDVVPLHADSLAGVQQVRDEQGPTVEPYPYDHVTPETNLALYVEAYHLTYGTDDRTHYTVEYEVQQRREQGGVAGWFGATEEQVTSQSSTYEGTSRSAREAVVLDLSRYAEASRLRITVRIIDEVSGQKASRAVEFTVQ